MTSGADQRICQAGAVSAASGPVPTRRTVLQTAGGAALVATGWALAACDTSPSAEPSPLPGSQHTDDPVTNRQRRDAVADENALLAAYQETGQRHPTLHGILAIPLAHHAAHLKALGVTVSSGTASAVAPASTTPPAATGNVPADPLLALRSLAAREQTVARNRRLACATATGEWAGLLGSIGACEAGHAALLGT
jgi:hypothetical protein